MRFITYAQNFEDVLLWRALRHVEQGYYVDVGAQHPVLDSVSRAFYEQGWRGIHVEPTDQFSDLLRRDRPDETVIQAAVGEVEGTARFFEIPDTGMSTAVAAVAERATRDNWSVRETTVEVIMLDRVFYEVGDRPVHWLKIDVEGSECAVLTSWCEAPHRPWIVLIEAITPIDGAPCHTEWEPLIFAKGYTFVHFDGINRYYVSDARPELVDKFSYGPCVFDEFQLPDSSRCVRLLVEERERIARDCEAALRAEIERLTTSNTSLIDELAAFRADLSRSALAAGSRPPGKSWPGIEPALPAGDAEDRRADGAVGPAVADPPSGKAPARRSRRPAPKPPDKVDTEILE